MARARARSRRSLPISGARRTLSRSQSPARSGAVGGGSPSSDEVRSTTSSSCLMSVDSPIPSRAASARTRALVSEVTRQMMKASASLTVSCDTATSRCHSCIPHPPSPDRNEVFTPGASRQQHYRVGLLRTCAENQHVDDFEKRTNFSRADPPTTESRAADLNAPASRSPSSDGDDLGGITARVAIRIYGPVRGSSERFLM
jgi:hypothetical protein